MTTTLQTPAQDNATPPAQAVTARPVRKTLAAVAALLALAAWVALPLNYWIAAAGGGASLVAAAVAMRQKPGFWRNLAMTTVVAAAVLLLVLAVFWAALIYLMHSL